MAGFTVESTVTATVTYIYGDGCIQDTVDQVVAGFAVEATVTATVTYRLAHCITVSFQITDL